MAIMKKIIFCGIMALGLSYTTFSQDRGHRRHHRTEQNMRPSNDPKKRAVEKTIKLDKKVNLTNKQERKVNRLHKAAAKQEIKLEKMRREHHQKYREILSPAQYQALRKANYNKPNRRIANNKSTTVYNKRKHDRRF